MVRKNIIRSIFLVTISVTLVTCVEYPPYEFPVDPIEKRNDSITLALNNILSSDSIENTVKWMQNMGTRFALANNRREVAASIRDKLKKMGYSDSRLDSFWITKTWNSQEYQMWQYNVIAELRGSIYPDSVMIIGAHYDAVISSGDPFVSTPGANDNASGTAAMIEIARVMKKKNYHPVSSIHFVAFGAEEIGLMGSSNYAGKMESSGNLVKLMVNNDMIANVFGSNPLTWEVNIIGYANSAGVFEKSKNMCSRYTSINYTYDHTFFNRSDSYPFFLRDYKTVFFISKSTDSYYHTTNDTYQKCNFDFCAEVAKMSCALLVWSDNVEL